MSNHCNKCSALLLSRAAVMQHKSCRACRQLINCDEAKLACECSFALTSHCLLCTVLLLLQEDKRFYQAVDEKVS
jgi:hypothetical protein